MEGAEEMVFCSGFRLLFPEMLLDRLVADDHIVFVGEAFQLDHNICGVRHVDQEHAEEEPNHEGKREIFRQPLQGAEDARMDQKIIQRPQRGPGQGELWTDNADFS